MPSVIISSNGNYDAQLNSVRRLASPNAASPLTGSQLPDDFLTDPAYLDASERFVLRNLGKTSAPSADDEDYEQIVYLIQIQLAIRLIPQLPGILRQTMVGESVQIQSYDWETRLEQLEDLYEEETEDIVPDSARIKVRVEATTKRPWPPVFYPYSDLDRY